MNAEKLIILTDQHGVFDDDPRKNMMPNLIKKIHFNDEKLERVAGKTGGALGSGGMYSKVMAAKQAAESKTISNIAWGREKEVLTRIYQGRIHRNINSLLAYIGLGSNLQNPSAQIENALSALVILME